MRLLTVLGVLVLAAPAICGSSGVDVDFDAFMLRTTSKQCSAAATWPVCARELRQCIVERGAARLLKTHVVVIELALHVPNAAELADIGRLAGAIRLPPDSLLALNATEFERIPLRSELSFAVQSASHSTVLPAPSDNANATQCSLYVLIALGCVDRFNRLRVSLDTINQLVQRAAICTFLLPLQHDQPCYVVRYFAASYRLATRANTPLHSLLDVANVRLRRSTTEDYYDEEDAVPEGSAAAAQYELPTSTERTPAITKAIQQPMSASQQVPQETTSRYATRPTSEAVSSVAMATRSIVKRTRLRVNRAARFGTLQLSVGVHPVYPPFTGLFLIGTVSEDEYNGPEYSEGLEDESAADPSRLSFSLKLLRCVGTANSCTQLRPWINVCNTTLCGNPAPDTVGSWQLQLVASLRDQPSVTATELFNITVSPRSAAIPASVNPESASNAAPVDDTNPADDDSTNALRLQRPIKNFVVHVGEVLNHQFPADTFVGSDSNGPSEVTYMVMRGVGSSTTSLPRNFWLLFNLTTRTVYALVLDTSLCGTHQFTLVATMGSSVNSNAFNVTVEQSSYLNKLTHHFVAIFNSSNTTFKNQIRNPIGVLRTFADFIGDPNPERLTTTFMKAVNRYDVNPISGVETGPTSSNTRMVLLAWSNNSIIDNSPTNSFEYSPAAGQRRMSRSVGGDRQLVDVTRNGSGCPVVTIRNLLYRTLNSGRLDTLSERFVSRFSEWSLLSVKLVGIGVCRDAFPASNLFVAANANLPGHSLPFGDKRNEALIRAMLDDQTTSRSPPEASTAAVRQPLEGNELLVTIIIPSIVIALALVLSALIGCVLYQKMRQSRKRRCNVAGGKVYFKKGVPVIFAEELDEHVSAAHGETPSRPLILPAEKPPLAPADLLEGHFSIQQFAVPDPSSPFASGGRSPQPPMGISLGARAAQLAPNNKAAPYGTTTLPPTSYA